MCKSRFVMSFLSALVISPVIHAAENLKAGLWAMTVKSDAMKNMPKIPPAQLEAMRKRGVTVPQVQDGSMVLNVCMTQEMVEREQPPAHQNESGCVTKNFNRSGNSYSVDMVCDGPNLRGKGTAKGTYLSKDSYQSTYDFVGTSNGRPANYHQEATGKWLGADCGSVKPLDAATMPARKPKQ